MGIFSLFNRKTPDEVYQTLAKKIVVAALRYRQEIDAPDKKRSADAGAEMVYLLIHLLDRQIVSQLGLARRDAIFDEVVQIAIPDYAGAVLNANASSDVLTGIAEHMFETLNARQALYRECQSFAGESFPGKGTILFAFSFFVHRALGNTERTDVEGILTGENELTDDDLDAFPDPEEIMDATTSVGAIAGALGLDKELKHLR